jgi:hypothetical protein
MDMKGATEADLFHARAVKEMEAQRFHILGTTRN